MAAERMARAVMDICTPANIHPRKAVTTIR